QPSRGIEPVHAGEPDVRSGNDQLSEPLAGGGGHTKGAAQPGVRSAHYQAGVAAALAHQQSPDTIFDPERLSAKYAKRITDPLGQLAARRDFEEGATAAYHARVKQEIAAEG